MEGNILKKSRFIIFLKEIYTKDKFSCWLSVCMMLLSTFFVIFLPKLLQYIIDESTQNVYIKDDSIENNILMGRKKEDCAYDEICKLVGMESILSKFPKEKDVSVGENGNKLSGGQKQRIAMARALVHADNVLILDEATSALDNITQNEIMKNIKPLYQDKIVIIITHRLDTISDVDKIFVMSEGRICEEGQHNELMKKGEKYYALVQNL